MDYKDSTLSLPFTYEYTESLTDSHFDTYNNYFNGPSYEIILNRRDITDAEKYASFYISGLVKEDGSYDMPNDVSVDFSYVTLINKNLFEFSGPNGEGGTTVYFPTDGKSTTNISFTNFKLDTLTGRLTFGYVMTYSPDDINNDDKFDDATNATITGNVDVVVSRVNKPVGTTPINTQAAALN